MDVPTLDFSPFAGRRAPNATPTPEQLAFAQQLGAVNRAHGFAVLANTGVSGEAFFDAAKTLFGLSPEEKARLAVPDRATGSNTGYFPLASEKLNSSRSGDAKEAYNVRAALNDFTATPTGFEAAALSFWDASLGLAEGVLTACALSLSLPPDFFASRQAKREQCTLRVLHYPPSEEPPSADAGSEATVDADADAKCSIRCGEHTDFGTVTLLFVDHSGGPDGAAGLEVKQTLDDGSTRWVPVTPPPGCVVVNTGGLLARWTNDAWRATAHRVVSTRSSARAHRYSIALFNDPDADVLVDCLPQFVSEETPARYAPITSGEYLLAKLAEAQRS